MKRYIKPEIRVEHVHIETLLGGLSGGNVTTPGVGSRYRNSLWDDDEDEWEDE